MAATFHSAPDVVRIARDLIPQYHPHLEEERVECIFREGVWASKGRVTYGTAQKVAGYAAFLATRDDEEPLPEFFLITINKQIWQVLTPDQRIALVDHELCHCAVVIEERPDGSERKTLTMRGHDLEEFAQIYARYGEWHKGLERFLKAGQQPTLELDAA